MALKIKGTATANGKTVSMKAVLVDDRKITYSNAQSLIKSKLFAWAIKEANLPKPEVDYKEDPWGEALTEWNEAAQPLMDAIKFTTIEE